jgi:hypothetical protein
MQISRYGTKYRNGTIYLDNGVYLPAVGGWLDVLCGDVEAAKLAIRNPNDAEELWSTLSDDQKRTTVISHQQLKDFIKIKKKK